MTFLELWSVTGVIILAMVAGLWLVSLLLRDSSVVDVFWGTGFVVIAWTVGALVPDAVLVRQWLIRVLVTAWGLRLSLHILRRNWGRGEDFRYRQWRTEAGPSWWWRSLFKVFLLQGVVMWIVAAPLVAALVGTTPDHLNWLDAVAVPVWLVGFLFEAVADWQLARFKSDPASKGKLMTAGLWHCTRHPNYFGDATAWWGHYLVGAASGAWWTLFSPVLMTFLLMRVSGVAMLESSLKETKPGYREYMESTSAFIPWPPRRARRMENGEQKPTN